MNNHIKQILVIVLALAVSLLCFSTSVTAGKPTKITVTAASPDTALQSETLDVVISGEGFEPGSTVRFLVTDTRDDTQIDVETVEFDGATGKLKAKIHVKDAAIANQYDIEVRTSSGRRGKGTTLFRVQTRAGGGNTDAECIVFTGDLSGEEVVEDCCPNAGPFPAYNMTLDLRDEDGSAYEGNGNYDGQLFINDYGAGRNHRYIVQFWNYADGICFEIIGGVIDNDKKNKVLTVTFEDEPARCEFDGDVTFPLVSFTLLRTSDLSYCQ